MKISQKLFLSFLGLVSFVLIVTLLLARWSFEQGFLDYINALEQQRLELIAEELLDEYQQAPQDWATILPAAFTNTIDKLSPNKLPKLRPPHDNRSPHQLKYKENQPKHTERFNRPPPPRLNIPKTALFGADGQWLAGSNNIKKDEKVISVPLVFQGENIGSLQSSLIQKIDSSLASAFSKQQFWASFWIGLICLLLAGCISWLFSKRLLKPVNRILQGISQLSHGDFSVNLSTNTAKVSRDELSQLMANINQLAITLEQNKQSKNRWLADISHELRTPLTILYGEIEMLNAGLRPFDKIQLKSIEDEVLRLNHLVDDLYQLSLSDIGGLRYQFAPVNLTDCVSETLVKFQQTCAEQGLILTIDLKENITIDGDKNRLTQLLNNLIINAMHYTDAPGKITLSLLKTGNSALLTINDTKPSVSQKECELLFEPLYRHDSSRTRSSAGAGLGLTICRNIVEAHLGSITATPSPLGGLAIHVNLPISRTTVN